MHGYYVENIETNFILFLNFTVCQVSALSRRVPRPGLVTPPSCRCVVFLYPLHIFLLYLFQFLLFHFISFLWNEKKSLVRRAEAVAAMPCTA